MNDRSKQSCAPCWTGAKLWLAGMSIGVAWTAIIFTAMSCFNLSLHSMGALKSDLRMLTFALLILAPAPAFVGFKGGWRQFGAFTAVFSVAVFAVAFFMIRVMLMG
jgi:hypothetical protein